MQLIRLYLVRHGHVDYFDAAHQPINPKYAPLSKRGQQQIEMLAQYLDEISLDKVFSSTMPRSIQTAEILVKNQRQCSIESYDEIREIKSGRLKDIPAEYAELWIKKAYYPKKFMLPYFLQGESWLAFETRVIQWFQQMLQQQVQSQHILVAAHDAVNRIVLNWVQGLQQQDVQVQEQHYGCLNIIDFYVQQQQIVESRILLQNFTADNILKIGESENALDQVYNIYMQTNGFKGDVA